MPVTGWAGERGGGRSGGLGFGAGEVTRGGVEFGRFGLSFGEGEAWFDTRAEVFGVGEPGVAEQDLLFFDGVENGGTVRVIRLTSGGDGELPGFE
jgi:hypothetical protein